MNETDVQPVASSATDTQVAATPIEQAVADNDVAAYRAAKRGAYQTNQSASSAAVPAEQAVSTETLSPPASESGQPADKNNAESRVKELLAERAQLRAELEAARRPPQVHDAKPAASSAAPVGEKFPTYETWSQQAGHESSDYEDYIDARAAHVYEQRKAADRQQDAITQKAHDEQTAMQAHHERAKSFIEDHKDYYAVIQPVADLPDSPTVMALSEAIKYSDVSPQLLYALGADRAELTRITTLPPALALVALGKLEASLSAAPVTRSTNTVTRATPPPPTLGSKATTPSADEAMNAVRNNDVATYRAVRLRERTAQLR